MASRLPLSISPTADRLIRPHAQTSAPFRVARCPSRGALHTERSHHTPRQEHRRPGRTGSEGASCCPCAEITTRGQCIGYWIWSYLCSRPRPDSRPHTHTHTGDTTDSQACTLHCYPEFARISSNPVPKSQRFILLPILILAQSLNMKHRTPWPIPFSRLHYGKSDKIWVGRLVVAEQSIRTPLNLQEVWQRGPAPTPPCCSSQPSASNGDFLLDCITDTDATAPLQMACASCMSVPAKPGMDRVPCPSNREGAPELDTEPSALLEAASFYIHGGVPLDVPEQCDADGIQLPPCGAMPE